MNLKDIPAEQMMGIIERGEKEQGGIEHLSADGVYYGIFYADKKPIIVIYEPPTNDAPRTRWIFSENNLRVFHEVMGKAIARLEKSSQEAVMEWGEKMPDTNDETKEAPAMGPLWARAWKNEQERLLLMYEDMIAQLKAAKPNDRSEGDRRYAIAITETEKAMAYFKTFVVEYYAVTE